MAGVPPPPQPLPGWYGPLIDSAPGGGLHGTWQYEIFSNARGGPQWKGPAEGNSESNPSWPFPGYSWGGPFQLTVMNTLYLLLAARLVQAGRLIPSVPRADTQLKDEFGFLWAWFGKDKDHPLPVGVPSLLQPVSDKPGDGVVVLERASSRTLALGYISKLFVGRVPQPYYPPTGGVFGLDEPDYKSGIGVFMRSLTQAFQQDHSRSGSCSSLTRPCATS